MRYQIVCNGNRVETHDEETGGLKRLEFVTREEADAYVALELEKLRATLRGPNEAKELHAAEHATMYVVDEIPEPGDEGYVPPPSYEDEPTFDPEASTDDLPPVLSTEAGSPTASSDPTPDH